MKKLLVVLVLAISVISTGIANAQQMDVYGEWLGSVAGGIGGGVAFGPVKVGAHFGGMGISVGGGANFPIMTLPVPNAKIDLCVDAQFHYSFYGIWSIPVGVGIDWKVTDKMSVYAGGGADIYNWSGLLGGELGEWANYLGVQTTGVGASFQVGVKYNM